MGENQNTPLIDDKLRTNTPGAEIWSEGRESSPPGRMKCGNCFDKIMELISK